MQSKVLNRLILNLYHTYLQECYRVIFCHVEYVFVSFACHHLHFAVLL